MKAYVLHPEEGFDSLQLVERPAPADLGNHQVCVRVRAVSLNYRDLVIARGAKKRGSGKIPASDGAGEVVAIGSSVTRFRVGDRVAAAFFPTWMDGAFREEHHANALGGSLDGMLAEFVVLDETSWVRVPSGYTYAQAAALPCAAVTAWQALYEAANMRSGDTLLVQGTGGVSIFALQLALKAGANVIATSSSAEKRERLAAMGAMATIDYRTEPEWGDRAREITGGRGVDVVVEVGGAGTFDQSAKALRYGGTMSILGVLAGTQGPISTYAILHKNLRIHGVYVGSVVMFESLVRALEATKIEPIIDREFPFDEVRDAYEYLASGKHFGKVVVTVG